MRIHELASTFHELVHFFSNKPLKNIYVHNEEHLFTIYNIAQSKKVPVKANANIRTKLSEVKRFRKIIDFFSGGHGSAASMSISGKQRFPTHNISVQLLLIPSQIASKNVIMPSSDL